MQRPLVIASLMFVSVLVVATVAPGCNMIPGLDGSSDTTTATTTTTTATGNGLTGCNAQTTCDDCIACAEGQTCASAKEACNENSACVGLLECFQNCDSGDSDCKTECIDYNQAGTDDYATLANCVYCDECPNACAGAATCQ